MRRSHSSPAILCRLIWFCIISRHRSSSIVCISMLYCTLCIWKDLWLWFVYYAWFEFDFGMYEKWDLFLWNWYCWKCFYIVSNDVRLTLEIGNFKSSHSLNAGHVPLGLGRDKHIWCFSQIFTMRVGIFDGKAIEFT